MIDLRFQPMKDRVKDPLGRSLYVASPFKKAVGAGYDLLERELKLLEATDITVESGHRRDQIRNDGWPLSAANPAHHDVRLFFRCKHGNLRYECNAFSDWRANLRAIGLWLQRQRLALEEWGIGTGGEAYRGFAALPGSVNGVPIAAGEWTSAEDAMRFLSKVNGCFLSILPSDLDRVYREAAKVAHPDRQGGNAELMSKVNRARDFIVGANG